MDKNGNVFERFAYASAQFVRDAIITGTGVGAAATIAYVLGGSLSPEQVAIAVPVALGVWRMVRKAILNAMA